MTICEHCPRDGGACASCGYLVSPRVVYERGQLPNVPLGRLVSHDATVVRLSDGRRVVVSAMQLCANPGKSPTDVAREIAYDYERRR